MGIGCGLGAAEQAVGIADPVSAAGIHAAPLVAPLVFVHVLIGQAQNAQAKTRCPGGGGTGANALDKEAVRIGVVGIVGGVASDTVQQVADPELHDFFRRRVWREGLLRSS